MPIDYVKFLASIANRIEPTPIREAVKMIAEYRKKGIKVISLAAGDPDPTILPRDVFAELTSEILRNEPRSVLYTPTDGIPELREELTNHLK